MATKDATAPECVVGVRFEKCGKAYHFDGSRFPDLEAGDYVIVETSRGRQMGWVVSFVETLQEERKYKPILRMATPQDLVSYQVWQTKAQEALETCKQKAAELGGFENVKFVQAEYNFDGSMMTIFYSTEDKVNVGPLRSAMRRSLRTKVDMHQIGPRDVAKMLEGYGACGIVRCCVTHMVEFCPISIRMAKAQSISLNPSEITGICGRLRCCLAYEYEQYREALKGMPKKGKWVDTPHGHGKVIDLLPLEDAAVVIIDEVRYTVPREDLALSTPAKPSKAGKNTEHEDTDADTDPDPADAV